ncbi:isoprenoid synthase domain-containing protein [Rhodocollybia butyracea]|uniref:Terpene synthase n=1 Tax=Rhodocollybia butyracea TaxID=206335 RepID=A0A9P5PMU5_9AGAR|nr:isoprenoid synthase domain-containing protein [Rhodocollybia butyracea]
MSILLGKSVFPPARQHPRTLELRKHNEEYFLGCWPLTDKSDAARQDFSRSMSTLADFTAKAIPDTEHWEKLVLASRVITLGFLIDDMLDEDPLYDSNTKFKIISGLLEVINGNKKPDLNLYWEVTSNNIWRGIQQSCTATEFSQMTRTVEACFLASHDVPLPESFEKWLVHRCHNSGADWIWSVTRYAMECPVTDEELTHPIVREVEDSAAVAASLVNDIVSLSKEKLANCGELNAISIIRNYGLASTEEEALSEASNIVAQSSRQLTELTKRGLADPMLSSEMKRWISAILYVVSGNAWWSQLTLRYNLPGLPAPRMTINIEGEGDTIIEPPWQLAGLEFNKSNDGTNFSESSGHPRTAQTVV